MSQINQGIYDTFVSPCVKAMSSEATAVMQRLMNPVRLQRWMLSDLNPWMQWVKAMAEHGARQPPPGRAPTIRSSPPSATYRSRSSRRSTAIATGATG